MKRWLPFAVLALAGLAVIVFVERRETDTQVGAHAILHLIADSEREANRLPARVWRLNDEEEVRIGDEMAERYLAGAGLLSDDFRGRRSRSA